MVRYRRKNKVRRIIIFSVIIILASIFLLGTCYAISVLSKYQHEDIDENFIGIDKSKSVDENTGITNIALFGIDEDGTSDSIMIVSIDKYRNKIKLTSMLRDSLVKIEPKNHEAYYTKLNEAYSAGGAETSLKAINSNYDLCVTEYASIKFDGMSQVINTVGGIDINITSEEQNWINGLIASTPELQKIGTEVKNHGDVHLNGPQAVAYSRIRKISSQSGQNGDYGRTDRQRAVMEKLFERVLNMNYTEYPSLIESLLPHMKTSLSIGKVVDLAGILSKPDLALEQARVPMSEYTINRDYDHYVNGTKKSTVYYNLNYASEIIKAFIYDDITPEDYMKDHPPVLEGGPFWDKYKSSLKDSSSNQSSGSKFGVESK